VFGADTARRLAECAAPLAISYDPDWEALWRSRFDRPLDDAETFVVRRRVPSTSGRRHPQLR
jgi:hypothetical protein